MYANLPAICPEGHVFDSQIFAVPPGVTLSIKGISMMQACPFCGKPGKVPEGTYEIYNSVLQILTTSKADKQALLQLKSIVEEAQLNGSSIDQVSAKINGQVPALKKLAKYLPSKKDIVSGIVLAVLIYLVNTFLDKIFKEEHPQEINVHITNDNRVINQNANTFPKVGRNDSCPCGSGCKYKHCHGKTP